MSEKTLKIFLVLIGVTMAVFAFGMERNSHTHLPVCIRCIPNGCSRLSKGEFIVYQNSDSLLSCISHGDKKRGHCCVTVRDNYKIMQHTPYGDIYNGECSMMQCSTAKPTSRECPMPYSIGATK